MKICNSSNNKSKTKFSLLKAFSLIMMLLIVLTSTNLSAFAADGGVGGEENTGGGETGGGTNTQSTWSGASQSGYRITVVDDNLVPVVPSVDWLFKEPPSPSATEPYANARTEANRQGGPAVVFDWNLFEIAYAGKKPPVPISVSGTNYSSQGEEFKEWFLGDMDTVGSSSSGGGGGNNSGTHT